MLFVSKMFEKGFVYVEQVAKSKIVGVIHPSHGVLLCTSRAVGC